MFISRNPSQRHLECEGEFCSQFTAVAPYYDKLMRNVPYGMWVDYVELLFSIEKVKPQGILDLACGTGNVSFELARRGYQVTGVDISRDMILTAEEKRRRAPNLSVEFLCQDLRSLAVQGEFDVALCLFDSLNYILQEEELELVFHNVARHIVPQGRFIFDLNSEYAFEAELFTQDNLFRDGELHYNWVSHYDPVTRLTEVEMFFEVREGNGTVHRFKEKHRERCYPIDDVERMLRAAGWREVKTYDAYTTARPRPKSERWYFVCALTE